MDTVASVGTHSELPTSEAAAGSGSHRSDRLQPVTYSYAGYFGREAADNQQMWSEHLLREQAVLKSERNSIVKTYS